MRSSVGPRLLLSVALFVIQWSAANAQTGGDDPIARMREANRQMQLDIDRMRLESERRQLEANRLIDDMTVSRRNREQQQRLKEALEATEDAAAAAKTAAKKANDDAADRLEEIQRDARNTRNNVYFGITLAALTLATYTLINKHGGETQMKTPQKDGIVAMLISILAMIATVIISEGHHYSMDLLHNILYILHVSYKFDDRQYLFNFRTSYVLFVFICTFAYGLTTYLQITKLRRNPEDTSKKITGGTC